MSTPSAAAREHRMISLITTCVAAELDHPDIVVGPDTAFTDLGLDSTGIVVVAGDISDAVGAEIPPETLFDFPTVRLLARHLAAHLEATSHA